jgi:hypothetical protein
VGHSGTYFPGAWGQHFGQGTPVGQVRLHDGRILVALPVQQDQLALAFQVAAQLPEALSCRSKILG